MGKHDVTFNELKNEMVSFVEARGDWWINNNKESKSLLLSAFIELGELSEKFQWKASNYVPKNDEERQEIAYELVDVFNYLFMFIHICGIDFPKEYFVKMEKLAKKFPIEVSGSKYFKVKETYRKSGKNKLYED